MFVNNLMRSLYYHVSVVLLGFWGGSVLNGKLDAGTRFVNFGQRLIDIFSRTFFPYLSRNIDKHTLYAKMNIIISLFLSVCLFIFAPLLIDIFFTEEFLNAVIVLRILSFSVFFFTLSSVYGTNYMIIEGYERQLRNITAVISVIGLCIGVPLIYYFDYIGAAFTIIGTQGLLGGAIALKAISIKKLKVLTSSSGKER